MFGVFRPAPPSNQGKWLAGSPSDAAEWGRRLWRLGNPPFHLIEVEVRNSDLAHLHFDPRLDRIGPAWFAEPEQLTLLNFVREVSDVAIR